MLSRRNLVPLKTEFPRIRKEGRVYDSPSYGLIVAYGSRSGPLASFIVSKKVDKRSVVRHEVKRKLADAVSPYLPRLGKNVELVFLAKGKAIGVSKEELGKELDMVLRRAKLI